MARTVLCELLGIDVPILQAGMASASTPALVAAVSAAGGLGVLGAARIAPDELRNAIREIRALTNRPFGVNLILAPPAAGAGDLEAAQRVLDRHRAELGIPAAVAPPASRLSPIAAQLDVIFEERVPVLSIGLGDPSPMVARAHAAGARVIAMVTTVEEAERVAAGGVDAIVAQGAEAGGHRSTFEIGPDGSVPLVGTFALVPQVVDAVRVPVVAAGGIVDGRGLVAALALGATGVQLGTRFLMAREAGISPAWRERLVASRETDTVVTAAMTGRPARVVRNRLVDEHERCGVAPLPWPQQGAIADDVYAAAKIQGNAALMPLYAGQALRSLRGEQSAAEIVAELIAEADACRAALAR